MDGQESKMCRLLKSLYGLKQAPKQWHEKFDSTLIAAGFVVNEADTCVYYRYGGGEAVMLCLYVDDILIFASNLNAIEEGQSSRNLNARVSGYDLFVFPQFYVVLFLFVSVALSYRFNSCVIPISVGLFSCFRRYLLSAPVMFKFCVYASILQFCCFASIYFFISVHLFICFDSYIMFGAIT